MRELQVLQLSAKFSGKNNINYVNRGIHSNSWGGGIQIESFGSKEEKKQS